MTHKARLVPKYTNAPRKALLTPSWWVTPVLYSPTIVPGSLTATTVKPRVTVNFP